MGYVSKLQDTTQDTTKHETKLELQSLHASKTNYVTMNKSV